MSYDLSPWLYQAVTWGDLGGNVANSWHTAFKYCSYILEHSMIYYKHMYNLNMYLVDMLLFFSFCFHGNNNMDVLWSPKLGTDTSSVDEYCFLWLCMRTSCSTVMNDILCNNDDYLGSSFTSRFDMCCLYFLWQNKKYFVKERSC